MRRAAALTLAAATLVAAACGSGDGDRTGPAVDDDAGTMVRALSLVPDTGDNAEFVLVDDYAAAGEALGLERPEDPDEDDVADWFIPITTGREDTVGGLQTSGFFDRNPFDVDAWRDEIGWTPLDVDVVVEVGPSDDNPAYYGFLGDFDPGEIDDAVTDEDNPWADELDRDGNVYVWGDDPEAIDPERVTTVRPLGRGGAMAVLDEHTILWSWSDDALEDGLAAATGEEDSLADDDDLAALAEAMDDAGAMGAVFSDDDDVFQAGEGPTLDPYEAFATGVRIEDGDPQLLVTLLHDTDDEAEDNVEALEEVVDDGVSATTRAPWRELLDLEDVQADGPILFAVLEPEERTAAGFWIRTVLTRDSLLAS